MALSNEDIIEAIGQKTVLEVVELIKAMEEKFGVTAAAASAGGPAAAAAGLRGTAPIGDNSNETREVWANSPADSPSARSFPSTCW